MMPLTPSQFLELREMLRTRWTGIVIEQFGGGAIGYGQQAVAELVAAGVFDPAVAALIDPIRDAYALGFFRERLAAGGINVETASMADIKAAISSYKLPLTVVEQNAIAYARQHAGQYAVGLGDRFVADAMAVVTQADRALREQIVSGQIRDATERALAERESWRTMASRLREVAEDSTRNWERLARTEMQDAQEHGVADDIATRYGAEALAAKIPNPDACPTCRRLHLDDDGEPRIFRLEELRANGSNAGKKQAEWLPVIGPVHPHCFCRLVAVPAGWVFEDGELVPRRSK